MPIDGSTDTDGDVDAFPACEMTLPDEITEDLTLQAGCVVQMIGDVSVENDAFLTVEAGVRIEAAPGAWLRFGHFGAASGIQVRGTAEAPVVFTTASARPSPGQWGGLDFETELLGPSVIEHAIFEYGADDEAVIALNSRVTPGALAITDCQFRDNAMGAIHARYQGGTPRTFAALSRNTFERNGPDDVTMSPEMLAALDATNVLSGAIRLEGGRVDEPVVWPPFDVPVIAPDGIEIMGTEGQLVITDTHIQVGAGENIRGADGSLVATRVTFSSALAVAAPGDWCGLRITGGALRMEDSIIRHAGCGVGAYDASLYMYSSALSRTTMTGTTFESSGGVRNIYINGGELGDCMQFTRGTAANSFDLIPCGM
jgi:hypothetical protein